MGSSFSKGGMVLQDLVNELGRRLDYKVTNGRYQGISNAIGYDGIWTSPEGHTTIVKYRDRLIATGQIISPTSVLIVVGCDDTGELEAQVRGSRHAWDIRLISADALLKLVLLKESADDPETGRKIRSLIVPMEYTRLDAMIDVMFTTATDVEQASQITAPDTECEEASSPSKERAKGTWEFTDRKLLQAKRESIINALSKDTNANFIRKSASLYWNANHTIRIACAVSKRYDESSVRYWYAYHPAWDAFLSEADTAFFALGCMDLEAAFAIPFAIMHPLLDVLNTTQLEDKVYWHIHLKETSKGIEIVLPKKGALLCLERFRISLATQK
jgi:hypothetical protein